MDSDTKWTEWAERRIADLEAQVTTLKAETTELRSYAKRIEAGVAVLYGTKVDEPEANVAPELRKYLRKVAAEAKDKQSERKVVQLDDPPTSQPAKGGKK